MFQRVKVVFGVQSFSFHVASVIEYHIKNDGEQDTDFKQQLLRSFYIGNVVASVQTKEEFERFITDSKTLMSKNRFDWRG